MFQDEVIYVFERIALSPEEVCGMVVGDVCAIPYNPWHDWTVPLPNIPRPHVPAPEPDVSGAALFQQLVQLSALTRNGTRRRDEL